jgi:glycosyltransferase involved in cell wall biosynthesis
LLFNPFVKKAWWHATSDDEAQEIRELYPHARIRMIPNGLDLKPYQNASPLPRRAYMKRFAGLDSEPDKVVVSLGRLHQKKGLDVLIRAFGELLNTQPNTKLLIGGGDDGQLENLRRLVAERGLEESVYFVGAVNGTAKIDFLVGADAFALCSHSENFGNVYVEAMAAGLPIVASRNTPWRAVESRGCGRWVQAQVDDVASALLDVLAMNRDIAARQARAFAKEFSNERVGSAFLEVYNEMVARTRE